MYQTPFHGFPWVFQLADPLSFLSKAQTKSPLMDFNSQPLKIFFFPLMAHGHMIPMTDIARLFAAHGVNVTMVTTPLNAPLLAETVKQDGQDKVKLDVQLIKFPSVESGLPEGCENLDSITSPEMGLNFAKALGMLRQPFEQFLEENHPDCIVGDYFFPWIADVAKECGVPNLVFQGTSFFSLCMSHSIQYHAPHKEVTSETDIFIVPGLPHRIEMTRCRLPNDVKEQNRTSNLHDQSKESEKRSYGTLVNSFYQLEPDYAEHYRKVMQKKVWDIGPVSFINRGNTEKAIRGKKAGIDKDYFLRWLDVHEPDSVLYVSFGSFTRFSFAQLVEIAMGLEASGFPFIWVTRSWKKAEEMQFLKEFEERIKGQGLLIRDWAPQVLILDHPAIGGFMTHCGWNSTLEAVGAGVPMITWPQFAEQFYNEKLVTQILNIGVSVGADVWRKWAEDAPLVKKKNIEATVTRLMGNGEEVKQMRTKAKELGEAAKKAVEEGGSSYTNMTALIEELKKLK